MNGLVEIRTSRAFATGLMVAVVMMVAGTSQAHAASVGWSIESIVNPSQFAPNDQEECERRGFCDRYQIVVRNDGSAASAGPITVTDTLPAGTTTVGTGEAGQVVGGEGWTCPEPSEVLAVVTCTYESPIQPEAYAPTLKIPVTAPTASSGTLKNKVVVVGGGGIEREATNETPIDLSPAEFGLINFKVTPEQEGGGLAVLGGSHPYDFTTSFGLSSVVQPHPLEHTQNPVQPVENARSLVLELPAGFYGDPQATPKCPESDLIRPGTFASNCPAASRVGVIAFDEEGRLVNTTEGEGVTAIYNMVPQAGYPAEFAFSFAERPVYMYPTVTHSASGYRLRIVVPGIPTAVGLVAASATFFGNPAALNETGGAQAFLTNPANCSSGPSSSSAEADSWENPGRWIKQEFTSYPTLSGCNELNFAPTIEVGPAPTAEGGTNEADETSAYGVSIDVPQRNLFSEPSTPDLRDAVITLPAGVSISPSAANGLEACQATGANGIDIGQSLEHADEAGEGEAIAPDGFAHLTAGHCPAASTLGEVEVVTPLLENPLHGHLYLAEPECGGAGQRECGDADASDGTLYRGYIEVEGSGIVLKLAGTVETNPATGQITARFTENPQFPFSEIHVRLHGGPRAPLTNPQSCGNFTTTTDLSSWSAPAVSDASPTATFGITGCPEMAPFAPTFSSGSVSPVAGGTGSFSLNVSRQDREQSLSTISTTLPAGLVGMISEVPLCQEPQAAAGTCPESSLIGTTTVAAGAGTEPLSLSGRVYLTGPYGGAPFGLSVVVPAKVGPFNLGNVVVQAAISVDRDTGAVTATSSALPQIKDGVLIRLRSANVTIDRPGFMLNPTNCEAHSLTGTIGSLQGAQAHETVPYAVSGCKALRFAPSFTASTTANASKKLGAELDVKVAQPASGSANIRSVKVDLPIALPSRLTTLQKSCPAAVFAANPAGCPSTSVVGFAKAVTPVLPVPLTGPAYIVSHGGESFPNLVVVLQGDGVRIDLTSQTQIKKGVTSSNFASLPDVPVSSFELYLPEGPHSVLSAYGSLCKKLSMPTKIVGENGVVIKRTTTIGVTGCPRRVTTHRKAKTPHKKHKGSAATH
jgi:hypothetical protein